MVWCGFVKACIVDMWQPSNSDTCGSKIMQPQVGDVGLVDPAFVISRGDPDEDMVERLEVVLW